VPLPFQVRLAVYNTAGELVDLLYQGPCQTLPSSLSGLSSVLLLGQGGVSVSLGSQGGDVTWTGLNNAGAPVNSGLYYIQAQLTDPFGQVSTLTHAVNVIGAEAAPALGIYNAAGELVRRLPLPLGASGAHSMTLSSPSLAVNGGGALQALSITAQGGVLPATVAWNGLTEQGLPAASGVYSVLLVQEQGASQSVTASQSVMVLKVADPTDPLATAQIGPNP
jgi:hypothetical protein